MITLIETTIIQYLSTALETDQIYAERPVDLPAEYWIIERTGGGEENHIQTATVAVQSISSVSMLRAAEMNQAAIRAMRDLITVEDVSRCRLNASYNFTDSDTKQYRYQAVFDLIYMEGDEQDG